MGAGNRDYANVRPCPAMRDDEMVLRPTISKTSSGGFHDLVSVVSDGDDDVELAHSIQIHPTLPQIDPLLGANHSQKWECEGRPMTREWG